VGVPAALGAAHLLVRLLYGAEAGDPSTLPGVIAVIAGVTSISAYIPARRATRVDPATVLMGA
jgi:putative ABC transport system permease protein